MLDALEQKVQTSWNTEKAFWNEKKKFSNLVTVIPVKLRAGGYKGMGEECNPVKPNQQKRIFKEFTKILLLSETYRRPIGYLSETDMSDRDPSETQTCLIGDPSETDMPRPIENWHAWWQPIENWHVYK